MAQLSTRKKHLHVLRLCLGCKVLSRKRKIKRSVWVQEIFARRREQGEFHHLLQEMRQDNPESHHRYLRMSKERFDLLLTMVSCINAYWTECVYHKLLILLLCTCLYMIMRFVMVWKNVGTPVESEQASLQQKDLRWQCVFLQLGILRGIIDP